jgi:hypothetical protein
MRKNNFKKHLSSLVWNHLNLHNNKKNKKKKNWFGKLSFKSIKTNLIIKNN